MSRAEKQRYIKGDLISVINPESPLFQDGKPFEVVYSHPVHGYVTIDVGDKSALHFKYEDISPYVANEGHGVCNSKFIEWGSIPVSDLAVQPVGTFGIYILAKSCDDLTEAVIHQKFAAGAKACFSKVARYCRIETALVVTNYTGSKTPTTTKQIMVYCVNKPT